MENRLAAEAQTVLVEGSPLHDFGFDRLVHPLDQPSGDGLLKNEDERRAREDGISQLTEMIKGAGMQWTSSSYSMPLTSSSLSGVCSLKMRSAVLPAYFSQSGLGTESRSLALCFEPVSSEWEELIVLKVGSCVLRASRERSARRRLPWEIRARRVETWSGNLISSFLAA